MRNLRVLFTISFMLLMGVLGSARADGPLSLVTTVPLGTKAHDIVLQGNLAYVATDLGLTILDISNPASPAIRGSVSIRTSGGSQGVDVKGQYAYVASREAGLQIVDVSNPDAPQVIASARVSGQAWDVAVKDHIVYVASFSGELYLFDVSNPMTPQLVKVIGILKWSKPALDAVYLEKLNNYVTSGNALVTGVSVTGNVLVIVDWGLGRLNLYDVGNAANPVFKGTHYAPFLLKAQADPDRDAVYMLGAYGRFSGIFSVPISAMSPTHSTRYDQCSSCSFLPSDTRIGQGGIVVSPGGRYVVYVGGGKAQLQVVNASNPALLENVVSVQIGKPEVGLAQSMGLAIRDDYLILAGGALGIRVYLFPGLSN